LGRKNISTGKDKRINKNTRLKCEENLGRNKRGGNELKDTCYHAPTYLKQIEGLHEKMEENISGIYRGSFNF
jgi:hypothetical protein